ncbi:hypothetical protein Tco_1223380 [Tanacetum coccineum]
MFEVGFRCVASDGLSTTYLYPSLVVTAVDVTSVGDEGVVNKGQPFVLVGSTKYSFLSFSSEPCQATQKLKFLGGSGSALDGLHCVLVDSLTVA